MVTGTRETTQCGYKREGNWNWIAGGFPRKYPVLHARRIVTSPHIDLACVLSCFAALGRHEGQQVHCCDQQGPRRTHLSGKPLGVLFLDAAVFNRDWRLCGTLCR
jgi:hypothetical protein